ncbi:unnamed protein product, partial [Ectocarpus sp. 12 AP-2014]
LPLPERFCTEHSTKHANNASNVSADCCSLPAATSTALVPDDLVASLTRGGIPCHNQLCDGFVVKTDFTYLHRFGEEILPSTQTERDCRILLRLEIEGKHQNARKAYHNNRSRTTPV